MIRDTFVKKAWKETEFVVNNVQVLQGILHQSKWLQDVSRSVSRWQW